MLDSLTNPQRALTDGEQWERLASFFDDLPAWKATDWAAGYLPAFERDLGLSLDDPALNRSRLILDHGCGKGEPSRFLERQLEVGGIAAVDTSRAMIEAARARGSRRTSYIHLEQPTLLPFPNAFFDGAMSFFVFVTMKNADKQMRIARELHRVMAPGAPLCVLVNNPAALGTRFASVQVGSPGDAPEPGDPIRLRLYELGCDAPFLEAWDVFWPIAHYAALLSLAGFRHVHVEERRLDARYESMVSRLGIETACLDVERAIAPFVSIVGYRSLDDHRRPNL